MHDPASVDRPLLLTPPAVMGRARRVRPGRPPALIYSLLRLKYDEIGSWLSQGASAGEIGEMLDVARNTITKLLTLTRNHELYPLLEKALVAELSAKKRGEQPDELAWKPVEDFLFLGYSRLYHTLPFYKSMKRDLAAGRITRRITEKPGPKRKGKGSPPVSAPASTPPGGVPAGFSTKANDQMRAAQQALRQQLRGRQQTS